MKFLNFDIKGYSWPTVFGSLNEFPKTENIGVLDQLRIQQIADKAIIQLKKEVETKEIEGFIQKELKEFEETNKEDTNPIVRLFGYENISAILNDALGRNFQLYMSDNALAELTDSEIVQEMHGDISFNGKLSVRKAFYLTLFNAMLNKNLQNFSKEEELKTDLIGLLNDKAINRLKTLESSIEVNGTKINTIAEQFYKDLDRLSEIILNNQTIYKSTQDKTVNFKHNLLTILAKTIPLPVLVKLSSWMHQSLHFQTFANIYMLFKKHEDFSLINEDGELVFNINYQNNELKIESRAMFAVKDGYPAVNMTKFPSEQQSTLKSVSIGYFIIHKTISCTDKDLIAFTEGADLTSLSIKQIITPLFANKEDALKALNELKVRSD